jgi:hypothetical protein
MIISMAVLMSPVVLKCTRYSYHTEAFNNAKQIHLALLDFDSDYGSFPDASTIADVKAASSTSLPLGTTSSNEIFRQLIAAGTKSESIFWAKSTITPRKPDNVMHGSHALEKGECAFAYVAGLSASDFPGTPLLMTPVIPSKRCFERRKDYGERAVILFIDGSVKSFPIDNHGQVEIGGMSIFDPRQPFWGKAPDIKWPE